MSDKLVLDELAQEALVLIGADAVKGDVVVVQVSRDMTAYQDGSRVCTKLNVNVRVQKESADEG